MTMYVDCEVGFNLPLYFIISTESTRDGESYCSLVHQFSPTNLAPRRAPNCKFLLLTVNASKTDGVSLEKTLIVRKLTVNSNQMSTYPINIFRSRRSFFHRYTTQNVTTLQSSQAGPRFSCTESP